MTKPDGTPAVRTVRVFNWKEVPENVLRPLLLTTKAKLAGERDATNMKSWSHDQLVATAESLFGPRPPRKVEKPFVTVLVDAWLPKLASPDAVTALSHIALGRAPTAERERRQPKNRKQQVELIRGYRGHAPVRAAIRREFLLAYRRPERRVVTETKRTLPRPVELRGEGAQVFKPFEHQRNAWQKLDGWASRRNKRDGAMLVLPTGAGKTLIALDWLLRCMEQDPELRVLWLCDQQSIIDQTVLEAQKVAAQRSPSFVRRARAIHSAASEKSTLSDDQTRFAAATVQTFSRSHGKTINAWFKRPSFVVVDEAHHAGSYTYKAAFSKILRQENLEGIIGLSATPAPTGLAARRRVSRLFPERIFEVTGHELIEAGILARPKFRRVETRFKPTDEADELTQLSDDVPAAVLFDIGNSPERNRVIIDEYLRDARRWDKTLIFAASIPMADELERDLLARGVEARAVHSQRPPGSRASLLAWFKEQTGPSVLISVAMLNEGVDLPDAKTAFLARPVKNRRLVKQMVGRVLRGVPSGGSAEALIVDFRDDWSTLAGILGPESAFTDPEAPVAAEPRKQGEPPRLPRALESALSLLFEKRWADDGTDGTDEPDSPKPEDLHLTARSTEYTLVGCYRIDDDDVPFIPVLNVHAQAFEQFVARAREPRRMRSLDAFFEDLPEPRPSHEQLRALRECVAASAFAYHDLDIAVGPQLAVQLIRERNPKSDEGRLEVIREVHETTVARSMHPSFGAFRAEVDRLLAEGSSWRDWEPERRAQPESPRVRIVPEKDRRLQPILDRVIETGSALLPYELRGRVDPRIDIRWTESVVGFAYGYHVFKKKTGEQGIFINKLLRTEPDVVTDGLLEFLCWHELLHSVLLEQGHDTQFRELEAAWPGSAEFDGELGTFHERWSTDPKRYQSSASA